MGCLNINIFSGHSQPRPSLYTLIEDKKGSPASRVGEREIDVSQGAADRVGAVTALLELHSDVDGRVARCSLNWW